MKQFKERSEVSIHLIKVFKFIKDKDGKWTTNKEISECVGFSKRTVSAHTLHLVNAGIINQAEVFPEHKFQYSEVSNKRNKAFSDRLEKAMQIFTESGQLV